MDPVSPDLHRTPGSVTPELRRAALGHDAATVWFTGLSGSGKSTIANAVEHALVSAGAAATVLDGDDVRHGLCADLGFSPEDRTENIRRVGHVARLMVDAGLLVLCCFVSPYRADRDAARALHPEGAFLEVFVDTPVEVCEARDVKGLYAKARAGEIPNLSGVSAPFEAPESPELRIATAEEDVAASAGRVLDLLGERGLVPRR